MKSHRRPADIETQFARIEEVQRTHQLEGFERTLGPVPVRVPDASAEVGGICQSDR